jgi:MYXO-CTERM domain-containing protein
MKPVTHFFTPLLAIMIGSSAALANPYELDTVPFVGPGGQILTGSFSHDSGHYVDTVGNTRVYAFEFAEGAVIGNAIDLEHPGFQGEEFEDASGVPTGFLPLSYLGVQVVAPLKYWDGIAAPNFQDVTNGESMLLGDAARERVVGQGAHDDKPIFLFQIEDGQHAGDFHGHFNSVLLDQTLAQAGIYAIEAVVVNGTLDNPGTGEGTVFNDPSPSESIFFLYNFEMNEDDFEQAVERFNASLGGSTPNPQSVPEPASGLLAFIGVCALGMHRRRERSV